MKRVYKLASVLAVILLVVVLTGCGSKDKAKEVSFEAQYIRSDGNVLEIDKPVVTKITSLKELNSYYEENKDNYNFIDNSVDSISFATAIDKYDEAYFEKSFLVLVLIEEESSDIYHKVTSVKDNGKITIERNISDVESNAITDWHLIIEVSRDYMDKDYKVTLEDVE